MDEITINGVKVIYKTFEGVRDNRYEMTMLIGDKWKSHTLICNDIDKEYKMEEIVNLYIQLLRR